MSNSKNYLNDVDYISMSKVLNKQQLEGLQWLIENIPLPEMDLSWNSRIDKKTEEALKAEHQRGLERPLTEYEREHVKFVVEAYLASDLKDLNKKKKEKYLRLAEEARTIRDRNHLQDCIQSRVKGTVVFSC